MLAARQTGKSTTAAALALLAALLQPPALVLPVSRTMRQSGELFRKVQTLYHACGGHKRGGRLPPYRPVPVRELERQALLGEAEMAERETALQLELANGSRVVSLPGKADTGVGYSGVTALVIDEAARVPDDLYYCVRPMLARSRGRLVLLSTPLGKRGFFHQEWAEGGPGWERVQLTAGQCPHSSAAFLAEERRALGDRWFRQEYECSFEDAVGAVFAHADIHAALTGDVPPLFG
jgi:hypothetical protein